MTTNPKFTSLVTAVFKCQDRIKQPQTVICRVNDGVVEITHELHKGCNLLQITFTPDKDVVNNLIMVIDLLDVTTNKRESVKLILEGAFSQYTTPALILDIVITLFKQTVSGKLTTKTTQLTEDNLESLFKEIVF